MQAALETLALVPLTWETERQPHGGNITQRKQSSGLLAGHMHSTREGHTVPGQVAWHLMMRHLWGRAAKGQGTFSTMSLTAHTFQTASRAGPGSNHQANKVPLGRSSSYPVQVLSRSPRSDIPFLLISRSPLTLSLKGIKEHRLWNQGRWTCFLTSLNLSSLV